jgi:hypothetical protein
MKSVMARKACREVRSSSPGTWLSGDDIESSIRDLSIANFRPSLGAVGQVPEELLERCAVLERDRVAQIRRIKRALDQGSVFGGVLCEVPRRVRKI